MKHRRDDLDALMQGAREEAADVPPFRRVWRSALEQQRRRRARRRLLWAAIPLSAAALLAVVLVPAPDSAGPVVDSGEPAAELVELARSLSDTGAPLDFLLEPPGGSLLGAEIPAVALEPTPQPIDMDFEEML